MPKSSFYFKRLENCVTFRIFHFIFACFFLWHSNNIENNNRHEIRICCVSMVRARVSVPVCRMLAEMSMLSTRNKHFHSLFIAHQSPHESNVGETCFRFFSTSFFFPCVWHTKPNQWMNFFTPFIFISFDDYCCFVLCIAACVYLSRFFES